MHIFTMPNLALNVWTSWSKGSEATTKKLMDECARVCHFPNQVLRSLQTRRRQQKWVLLVSVCLLPSFDRWPSTGSIITCLLTAVQQSITLQEVSLLILPFFFFFCLVQLFCLWEALRICSIDSCSRHLVSLIKLWLWDNHTTVNVIECWPAALDFTDWCWGVDWYQDTPAQVSRGLTVLLIN